jgi:hypothetical protein
MSDELRSDSASGTPQAGLPDASTEALKLCYVDGRRAYFTTQDIDDQWGDDWDDVPYEHNAGRPYCWHEGAGKPWQVVSVFWTDDSHGCLIEPSDGHLNSPYAVEDINEGQIPWIRTDKYWEGEPVAIMAGDTLAQFIHKLKSVGGTVYLPWNELQAPERPADINDSDADGAKREGGNR